jgi:EAL domain-containing protein (putative c-di-GMP-specific phosphodiesterase class I)
VTGAVLHYEALSRLVRRDGVVVSAGDLIATAERLGLVDRIDRRSLALVVRDLTVNPRLALSVNVSAATLVNGAWMEALVDAIRTDRTIAGRLTVEITETAALSEPAVMRRAAETLRDVGCKVAIDDFGVGHTSLKGLRDLEIDWLKIDGSFVRDIAEDPDSAMFVRTLVGLADHLGVPTVAEWVEGPDAARVLADLGVVGLQGRHAGLPRLRVPEDPEVAAVARAAGRPELRDGYPAVDGLLEGPLACG